MKLPFGLPATLFPPIAISRMLDDLHEIAMFFRSVGPRLDDLTKLADRLEVSIRAAIPVAEAVNTSLKMATPVAEAVDASLKTALPLLDALSKQVEIALPLLDKLEPIAKRAVEMASPLEGAAERLGRVVDRLPRSRRTRELEGGTQD